jgi:ATP-dependent Lhr-like helicase
LLDVLSDRGAMFPQELQRCAKLPAGYAERGLADLVSHGLVTCDSFAALRQMITPPSRRKRPVKSVGRWSMFRSNVHPETANEFLAKQVLQRTGVVFRKILEREKLPIGWAALARVYRGMELRGEVRGGRFVAGFSGEQFALPEAVELLRKVRRSEARQPISVTSADPLNFQGILTPTERISPATRRNVLVG